VSFQDSLEKAKRTIIHKDISTPLRRTRKRRKYLIAIEMAKFIISKLRFAIVGPTYTEIGKEFGVGYDTIKLSYLQQEPLNKIFEYKRWKGVVVKPTKEAIQELNNITPAIKILTWTDEDLDRLIGPTGIINTFFLNPDEVMEVLNAYGETKFNLRSGESGDNERA
jgi:hypothetical protein